MSLPALQQSDWHRSLAQAIRDPEALIRELSLSHDWIAPARRAAEVFPLLVPRSYLRRMQPGNPHDPLLRQVLPLEEELLVAEGFTADPVDDAAARKAPGLLHKYRGRALLVATGSCAVHCRYCFRREYPYQEEPRTLKQWEPAFQAIACDEFLHEIILSGGDPLMLTDRRLHELIGRLEEIPHLRRLRIHTRLPIVLPDRVTPELVQRLREGRLTPIVVVHANHPHEIAGDCAAALSQLVQSGLTVLNQAVLLRGINDGAEAQIELSERLIDLGVIPYYLHQLDRVQGTSHFEVEERVGQEIIAAMRKRLPGYGVPQYVREVAGQPHKVPVIEA